MERKFHVHLADRKKNRKSFILKSNHKIWYQNRDEGARAICKKKKSLEGQNAHKIKLGNPTKSILWQVVNIFIVRVEIIELHW